MTDAAFWDRIAPKYAKDKISDPDAYAVTLGRMREILQPDASVLELGCGTGSTAVELAPGVGQYLGTDVSPGMIKIARGKLDDTHPSDLTFEVAPAGELPAGDFDAILALNLLHLVPDLEEVIAKVYDALPRGGLFISKTGLLKDGNFLLGLAIPVMRLIGKAPYVRSMRHDEFVGMLTKAGFEITEELAQPGIAPRLFLVARKP